MRNVFIASDNIVSPLGLTTAENFAQLKINKSAVQRFTDETISSQPFYASLFSKENNFLKPDSIYTKFEQLLITSITDVLQKTKIDISDESTILIISTTKGNISLLETETLNDSLKKRIALHTSAKLIAEYFGFVNTPLVVSNACISGVLGILTGMRLLQNGSYKNAVVAGADVISKFVLSGFQSFQAISQTQCKPFDVMRDGINLGEGAATVILSSEEKNSTGINVVSGATSNDANHISGPSRTGEELNTAIRKTLQHANLSSKDIDFISAHGTATLYNDEMEAKAFTLADLQYVPLNSLKGFYGHTLGAAGLLESVVSIQSLKENIVLPTKGFENIGVTKPLNICSEMLYHPLKNCLKTASGFGGCNAAVLFSKE
jgi:3-oxoacyl-[acyl-carrier-protein] synthase I